MSAIDRPLERPSWLGALLALAAAAVLGAANYFEHVVGLEPCTLCLYQRVPWWVALGLGCVAILARRAPVVASVSLGLAILVLLAGAALAGYHAGVEWGVLPGPSGCSGDAMPQSLDALNQSLAGPPPARCDEVPWSLFGISMAGYNFLLSVGAAVLLLLAMRRAGRNRP